MSNRLQLAFNFKKKKSPTMLARGTHRVELKETEDNSYRVKDNGINF